jgi:neutral ceramidase
MSDQVLAGFGEAPITPPLGVSLGGWLVSEGRTEPADEVIEDLLAQVVLVGEPDGAGIRVDLGIAVLDAITLPAELLALLRRDIAAAGAEAGSWLIAATHSHSAPDLEPPNEVEVDLRAAPWDPVVLDCVREGFRQALAEALADLAPASPRAGRAECGVNVNRRRRGPDGEILGLPWMGKNPDGPVDHGVDTLRFARAYRPDIVLASYGCHPAVLGTDSGISPDLFGPARRRARELLRGARIVCAQGVSGDVNPVVHPGTRADCERLGDRLGEAIAAAVDGDRPERAGVSPVVQTVALATRTTFPRVENRQEQDWIDLCERRLGGRRAIDLEVTIVRLGSTDLVGLPVELFTQIGVRLRELAAPRDLLFLTHCGGTLGYLPTAVAYAEGGYEPLTTPFAPGADDQLVEALAPLLAGPAPSVAPPSEVLPS